MTKTVSDARQKFLALFSDSLPKEAGDESSFLQLTLSRPTKVSPLDADLKRIDLRLIVLRGVATLTCNYRYERRDETKNLPLDEGLKLVEAALQGRFLGADLRCRDADHSLRIDRKGEAHLVSHKASSPPAQASSHDRAKKRHVDAASPWLRLLGLSDEEGSILPRMQDKYRQIDKFIEILGDLVPRVPGRALTAVDMGSGKAYLTFALYEHLRARGESLVCGVEQRPGLVKQCQDSAAAAGFSPTAGTVSGLTFVEGTIADWRPEPGSPFERPDILMALHACDTATDDAIASGLRSQVGLIVVSPCCHKQVRVDLEPEGILTRITRFGILEERLAEILTDSIRALVLEAYGYRTKVFEFISTEHTGKNLMITAVRTQEEVPASTLQTKLTEARELAARFGVIRHYLLEKIPS